MIMMKVSFMGQMETSMYKREMVCVFQGSQSQVNKVRMEIKAFWSLVISLKYGEEEGGWRTREVNGRNGVGLWKAITKKWLLLDGGLAYHVGSGQRVRFWMDKWCGDEPLCESFSSLFSISLSKNAWVLEVWNPAGNGMAGLIFLQGRLMIKRSNWWSFCCRRSMPSGYKGRRKIE
ncbi:hypothetical protein CK203_026028 [Vitis vinifera]|uniref:Uncharacterized protein n=1 Tax=Vitis vinifera TaxID=29760 RepID=A0A438IJB3_VITVI|nr:hypothetical protein CK203_026028 [Vitis vinifera]